MTAVVILILNLAPVYKLAVWKIGVKSCSLSVARLIPYARTSPPYSYPLLLLSFRIWFELQMSLLLLILLDSGLRPTICLWYQSCGCQEWFGSATHLEVSRWFLCHLLIVYLATLSRTWWLFLVSPWNWHQRKFTVKRPWTGFSRSILQQYS